MSDWKVGELARLTGITVRTLHHYDEIGLLQPDVRTSSGHRLYSDDDVRRLYRIVALRGLGLSLDAIGRALDGSASDLTDVVRLQLQQLDEEVEAAERLRARLRSLLETLESTSPSAPTTDVIEVMAMMSDYYTPEQLAELEQRRAALGEDGMREAEAEWASVAENLNGLMADGVDPADPRVQAEITRADSLLAAFTGGNPGIQSGLNKMWQDQDPEQLSRGLFSRELFSYMGRAREARQSAG